MDSLNGIMQFGYGGCRLNPRHLQTFRAVMLSGSMTEAARLLRISQPAVSRMIRDFEEDVGLLLFERIGNRLVPSAEAAILFNEIVRFYDGIDRIAKVAGDLKTSNVGSLRIASFNALSLNFMSRAIETFTKSHPDVSIYLETEASRTILELVALHRFDVGIVQTAGDYPGVSMEQLPTLDAECVLPLDHALTAKQVIHPHDLEGETLISLGQASPLRAQTDALLAAYGVTCQRRIETTFAASACDLASRGLGLCIIDPFTIDFYGVKNIARRPFSPAIPYHFAVVTPLNKKPTKLVNSFLDTLRPMFEV